MTKKIGSLQAIRTIEHDENTTPQEELRAWAALIKSGVIWELNGSYQRGANHYISRGIISQDGDIDWDKAGLSDDAPEPGQIVLRVYQDPFADAPEPPSNAAEIAAYLNDETYGIAIEQDDETLDYSPTAYGLDAIKSALADALAQHPGALVIDETGLDLGNNYTIGILIDHDAPAPSAGDSQQFEAWVNGEVYRIVVEDGDQDEVDSATAYGLDEVRNTVEVFSQQYPGAQISDSVGLDLGNEKE